MPTARRLSQTLGAQGQGEAFRPRVGLSPAARLLRTLRSAAIQATAHASARRASSTRRQLETVLHQVFGGCSSCGSQRCVGEVPSVPNSNRSRHASGRILVCFHASSVFASFKGCVGAATHPAPVGARRSRALCGVPGCRPACVATSACSSIQRLCVPAGLVHTRAMRSVLSLPFVVRMSKQIQAPNPSLERTSPGKALGPRSGVVHHPHRGPSALPAAAAQLKR